MNLYIDEDTAGNRLVAALRHAGHHVQTALGAGLTGESDPVQMRHAIQSGHCILTRNYSDFEELHDLLATAHGHHFGIIVIRRDDSARRNMLAHDIVRALGNLEAAGAQVSDEYLTLNQWQ